MVAEPQTPPYLAPMAPINFPSAVHNTNPQISSPPYQSPTPFVSYPPYQPPRHFQDLEVYHPSYNQLRPPEMYSQNQDPNQVQSWNQHLRQNQPWIQPFQQDWVINSSTPTFFNPAHQNYTNSPPLPSFHLNPQSIHQFSQSNWNIPKPAPDSANQHSNQQPNFYQQPLPNSVNQNFNKPILDSSTSNLVQLSSHTQTPQYYTKIMRALGIPLQQEMSSPYLSGSGSESSLHQGVTLKAADDSQKVPLVADQQKTSPVSLVTRKSESSHQKGFSSIPPIDTLVNCLSSMNQPLQYENESHLQPFGLLTEPANGVNETVALEPTTKALCVSSHKACTAGNGIVVEEPARKYCMQTVKTSEIGDSSVVESLMTDMAKIQDAILSLGVESHCIDDEESVVVEKPNAVESSTDSSPVMSESCGLEKEVFVETSEEMSSDPSSVDSNTRSEPSAFLTSGSSYDHGMVKEHENQVWQQVHPELSIEHISSASSNSLMPTDYPEDLGIISIRNMGRLQDNGVEMHMEMKQEVMDCAVKDKGTMANMPATSVEGVTTTVNRHFNCSNPTHDVSIAPSPTPTTHRDSVSTREIIPNQQQDINSTLNPKDNRSMGELHHPISSPSPFENSQPLGSIKESQKEISPTHDSGVFEGYRVVMDTLNCSQPRCRASIVAKAQKRSETEEKLQRDYKANYKEEVNYSAESEKAQKRRRTTKNLKEEFKEKYKAKLLPQIQKHSLRGFFQTLNSTQQGLALNMDFSVTTSHESIKIRTYLQNQRYCVYDLATEVTGDHYNHDIQVRNLPWGQDSKSKPCCLPMKLYVNCEGHEFLEKLSPTSRVMAIRVAKSQKKGERARKVKTEWKEKYKETITHSVFWVHHLLQTSYNIQRAIPREIAYRLKLPLSSLIRSHFHIPCGQGISKERVLSHVILAGDRNLRT